MGEESALSDSRRAKIQEIMRLQGLYDTLEQMRASGRARSAALLEEQFTKMVAADTRVPTDYVLEARLLLRKALEEVEASWTFEEALDVYALHYGGSLTDEDLDQIIAYWSSPTGRKEVEASRVAMGPFVEFIQKRSEQAFGEAMARYQEGLKALLENRRSKRD